MVGPLGNHMFAGHALAAGTATAAATSLSHPLDTLKTLIQALNPYSLNISYLH